jgi:hypothetical protein
VLGSELVDEAVSLLSTAIGMIMEDHAAQAIEIGPAPLAASHFDELRAAGSDIAILASACEALLRRRVD